MHINSHTQHITVLTIDPHTTPGLEVTCPGWPAHPIPWPQGSLRSTIGPSFAHDRRLSQGLLRQRGVVSYPRCTSTAAGELQRWHLLYIYQAQSRTAFHRCSPSRRCRSLVPVPAVSWLDLRVSDYNYCHGQGLHLWPYKGLEWSSPLSLTGSHHSWKLPLSVVSSAQLLPHQQPSASQLQYQMGQQPCCTSFWFCWVLCGSGSWARQERGQQLEGSQEAHCLVI